jgi:hypothetical protein
MADVWPSNVKHTFEIGSQRGPEYDDNYKSFSDVVNAFLGLGWRIINTYVEGKGPDTTREECLCLMGWSGGGKPRFPPGYSS